MTRSVTVGRKPAMIISRRMSEVREMPGPGTVWEWSSVEAGQGTLQHMRDAGLIVRDRELNGWRTTRKLARFLDERHGVTLGRSGQTSLDAFR